MNILAPPSTSPSVSPTPSMEPMPSFRPGVKPVPSNIPISLDIVLKKATIPDSVKYLGTSYQVVEIANNVFKGCTDLKKITIKAKSLKKVGKKAFKGVGGDVTIKVPKKLLKKYKKLFKKIKITE